jgi:Bacterial regulatory protein, Fis family
MTTQEDTRKLARQIVEVANQSKAELVVRTEAIPSFVSNSNTNSPSADSTASLEPVLKHAPFSHSREVSDAIHVVNQIALGRNPFSDEPFFESLLPEYHNSVLRSLCVIVSSLTQPEKSPVPAPSSESMSAESIDSSGKRPLVPYLERVEREAIMEALEETNHNVTAAAKLLGISFRALRYRMERLEMQ